MNETADAVAFFPAALECRSGLGYNTGEIAADGAFGVDEADVFPVGWVQSFGVISLVGAYMSRRGMYQRL